MIYLNSKEISFNGDSLYEILKNEDFDPSLVACEVDSKLVKRVDFKTFIPGDGAKIEVFSFVGGGWDKKYF